MRTKELNLMCSLQMFSAKQEDDEMVLQIVYLFYNLVLHEATRKKVTKQSRILHLFRLHVCTA
jgi:hypothetical protein